MLNDIPCPTISELQSAPPSNTFSILFVDDEANILSALRRLFRSSNYRIFTAESGEAGLAILETEAIDVIVSDMRMPQMDGAHFLSLTLKRWPKAIRILLTGYADMNSTIAAINQAKISCYISKPWNDEEIRQVIDEALTIKKLEYEQQRLQALVAEQNKQLKSLNTALEDKVKERTIALEVTMKDLSDSHEKLKKSFITSIKVFSSLIEMRAGKWSANAKNVAELARKIATYMKLTPGDAQDIFLAGLLHGIGKISFSDALLNKDFMQMTHEERAIYYKYPIKGQAALMALEQLQQAAQFIRSQHERFDGLGFPDRLRAEQTPIGARILGISHDFIALQSGAISGKVISPTEAIKTIEMGRNKRYDPAVVDAFLAVVCAPEADNGKEQLLRSKDLVVGMMLSRDLCAAGAMLLARDYILDERLIQHIRHFEESDATQLKIYIRVE